MSYRLYTYRPNFFVTGTVGFGPRTQHVKYEAVAQMHFGNAIVRPVLTSIHRLPLVTVGQFRVGQILCETFWPSYYRNGEPQSVCPRYVARRQLSRLQELGYRLKSGFEAEFAVFRTADGTTPLFDGKDMLTCQCLAEVEPLLYAIENGLAVTGVDVLTVQTENGPGQMELTLAPVFDVAAADAMFRLREAVKEMCSSRDLYATFMAKSSDTSAVSGLHFNHSLWSPDTDQDQFDAAGELSEVGRRWLAGLVRHAPALTALCAPTVNCYRRLHRSPAPIRADWGFDDRLSAFRVQCGGAGATFIENRISSGPANPYLVLAATVAAGIDGLETGIAAGVDDVVEVQMLPTSLDAALDALQSDEVMVDALGTELVDWFVKIKREVEIAERLNNDHSDAFTIERELYFKFL